MTKTCAQPIGVFDELEHDECWVVSVDAQTRHATFTRPRVESVNIPLERDFNLGHGSRTSHFAFLRRILAIIEGLFPILMHGSAPHSARVEFHHALNEQGQMMRRFSQRLKNGHDSRPNGKNEACQVKNLVFKIKLC